MALLLMEGFETYATSADATAASHVFSNDWDSSVTTSRGGRALYTSGGESRIFMYTKESSTDTYYVGFAYSPIDAPNADRALCQVMSPSGEVLNTLYHSSSHYLYITRGTTPSLGTGDTVFYGTYNYIVFKIRLHDTAGTVEMWVNGDKQIDLTSQDTLPGTDTTVGRIMFQNYFNSIYIDDIYVGDTYGSTGMIDQVSEVHIELLTPDGNGNRNDFTVYSSGTSHYQNVDDGYDSDDDTTYNYSNTATDGELYTVSNITGNYDTIHAVAAHATVKRVNVGIRGINTVIRSNTSETDGDIITPGYPAYSQLGNQFTEYDPNTGVAWTESGVNSIQVGVEIDN